MEIWRSIIHQVVEAHGSPLYMGGHPSHLDNLSNMSKSSTFGGSLTNILVMVFLLCLRFMLARGFRENGCERGKSQDECQKQHSSRLQYKYKDKEITDWVARRGLFYAAQPMILRLLPRF